MDRGSSEDWIGGSVSAAQRDALAEVIPPDSGDPRAEWDAYIKLLCTFNPGQNEVARKLLADARRMRWHTARTSTR
jgi:hypothetical protein